MSRMRLDIYQAKALFWPRFLFKHFLSLFYPVVIKIWPLPVVKSIDETIDKLINERLSISRFGDGEFFLILEKKDIFFQKYDIELRQRLIEILKSENPKVLIGLPGGYHSLKDLTNKSKLFWRSNIVWIYPRLRRYLNLRKEYYNSFITRPYIEFINKENRGIYFEKIMKLWEGREILLIEGTKSKLGIGNNLFHNAKNVERILAPATDAFRVHKQLLKAVSDFERSKIVLIALGPTATVLAYDIALLGFQAIDTGNLDIEYEWFLRKTSSKVKIPGKYTNEASGGRDVEDIDDVDYKRQVILNIG